MENAEHRAVAVKTFNRCWEILEAPRSAESDAELLTTAHTSRFHWLIAGGAREAAIADWMVSRAYSHVDEPSLAVVWAEAAMAGAPEDSPAWMKASLYEGLARAYKTANDTERFEHNRSAALAALALEEDEQDAALIRAQIEEL
jgi:hypothetical protein